MVTNPHGLTTKSCKNSGGSYRWERGQTGPPQHRGNMHGLVAGTATKQNYNMCSLSLEENQKRREPRRSSAALCNGPFIKDSVQLAVISLTCQLPALAEDFLNKLQELTICTRRCNGIKSGIPAAPGPQMTVKEPDDPEVWSLRNQVLMSYLMSSVMNPKNPKMKLNEVQTDYDTFSVSTEWDSRRSVTFQEERDGNCCFRRRCFCITGVVLLTLGAISAFITLGVIYGIPGNQNFLTRECKASSGQAGFLCDDRITCIVASALCDGKVDCGHGEDESTRYCGNVPNSLPEGLVFKCANMRSWTYIDKLCDNKNDCGDCSDETALRCPPCPGWRCNTVFFTDCDCIPNTRCNDSIQDCIDWSDETSCL